MLLLLNGLSASAEFFFPRIFGDALIVEVVLDARFDRTLVEQERVRD